MKNRLSALSARPEFWLTCLLFWLVLSTCRSLETPWARASLTEALRWGAGIGLMLALGRTLRSLTTVCCVVTVCAGLMALAGIWDGLRPEQGGLAGPYHDHQLYGSALLILLPFPTVLWLTSRETKWRYLALTVTVACALCLVFSQTRSAWAGLLVSAVVFGGLWFYQSGRPWHEARFAALAIAAMLGTAIVLWIALGSPDQQKMLAARADTFSTLSADGSWQGRLSAWRGAEEMTAASPLIGVGLGRYPGMQQAWTHTGRLLAPAARPSLSEQAHSFYLQTVAETGLIGLSLYLAALAAFACLGLRRLRRTRGRQLSSREALVVAALSMIAGQAVDAIASPSWQFAETSLLFWALLGIGVAAMTRHETNEAVQALSRPIHRAWRLTASGGAAIFMTANFLPIGLLTPVEAYTPPAGWTYVPSSTVLTSTATTAHVGDVVYYTLTANYSDAGKAVHSVNVSNDQPASYVAVVSLTSNTPVGTWIYDSATRRMKFTVPAYSGSTLYISSNFKDGFVTKSPATRSTLVVQ